MWGRELISRRFARGVNKFFDGIAKVVEQFAEELAVQRLRGKEQKTGRGSKAENSEKKVAAEKRVEGDFPELPEKRLLVK